MQPDRAACPIRYDFFKDEHPYLTRLLGWSQTSQASPVDCPKLFTVDNPYRRPRTEIRCISSSLFGFASEPLASRRKTEKTRVLAVSPRWIRRVLRDENRTEGPPEHAFISSCSLTRSSNPRGRRKEAFSSKTESVYDVHEVSAAFTEHEHAAAKSSDGSFVASKNSTT